MLAAVRAATTVGLIMRSLKLLLLASAAGLLAVSAAAAADLPTKKTPPAAEKPNCYASFWTWLDSTAADCPLSVCGITVYGTIDMGGGYETHATKFNKRLLERRQRTGHQDEQQRALAVGAERPQPVEHRRQDQGADRAELVHRRRRQLRLRPLFVRRRQRAGVAGRQQHHHELPRPDPPTATSSRAGAMGQHPRLPRRQQPDLRHADLRPPVLASPTTCRAPTIRSAAPTRSR